MNTNEKEKFRKWMLKKYGGQDSNDYAETFTEDT
jgi:hypothetical protein